MIPILSSHVRTFSTTQHQPLRMDRISGLVNAIGNYVLPFFVLATVAAHCKDHPHDPSEPPQYH